MKDPIIAVVTPVFNGEETIENSINSLKNQTLDNWVNIIVNDGSTDRTIEILDQYKNDNRFAYLSWFMLGLIIVYPLLRRKIIVNQHKKIGLILLIYFGFTFLMNVVLPSV